MPTTELPDVIDTDTWTMKRSRNAQYDDFASSVIGDGDPNDFWIHEYAEQSRDIILSDLSHVTVFSQFMTVVPAGTDEGNFETAEKATASGFPVQQLFWFFKAD